MADRLAVMRAGEIVQMGAPNDLFFNPADAFIAQFFGETNLVPGFVDQGWVVTDLGRLRTTTLPHKTKLDVLIRPEALQLCPIESPGLPEVEVEASRQLGRQSMIHMAPCNWSRKSAFTCKDGGSIPAPYGGAFWFGD